MNEDNLQSCQDLVDGGCMMLLIIESCPLQFRCGDAASPVPTSETETPASVDGSPEPTNDSAADPSLAPTRAVLASPTRSPTPSSPPTAFPTRVPTQMPSRSPITGFPTKLITSPAPTATPIEPPITVSPTQAPTQRSVFAVPTKAPTNIPSYVDVLVDFEYADDETTKIPPGAYVESEWSAYGLSLSASGGFGTLPRIFDSSNPEPDDMDLGSPNMRCTTPGPGVGEGGEPDTVGANCKAHGNVLIVQDKTGDVSIPNDNGTGGMIVFDFDPTAIVYEIGLLDIDYETTITIMYQTPGGNMSIARTIQVPLLGDNSYQVVEINVESALQVIVNFRRSGAVAFISFAYKNESNDTSRPPTTAPVVGETEMPTVPAETPAPTTFAPAEMSLSMSMSMSM